MINVPVKLLSSNQFNMSALSSSYNETQLAYEYLSTMAKHFLYAQKMAGWKHD